MPEKKDFSIALCDDLVDADGELNYSLSEDDFDVIREAADVPCVCTPRQKAHKGRGLVDGETNACLPCTARDALNLLHDISTRDWK